MLRVRRRHDLAQVCQERTSLLSLLHQHAAAIHRIHLAPGEAQFAQPVQGTGDGGLGDVELRRQATHRMRASGQIDGEEDAKLAAGKIGFVAPDQGQDRLAKHLRQGFVTPL